MEDSLIPHTSQLLSTIPLLVSLSTPSREFSVSFQLQRELPSKVVLPSEDRAVGGEMTHVIFLPKAFIFEWTVTVTSEVQPVSIVT